MSTALQGDALREAAIVDVNAALDDVMRERPFTDQREAARYLLRKGFDDWNAKEFQRDAYLRAIKKRFRDVIAERAEIA